MQAARIHEDLTLRLDDVDTPKPGPGEVLVRIHAAGVCGTDLHILDGMIKPDPYPMTLGHEAAGVVESAGEGCQAATRGPRRDLQQDLLRAVRAMPARAARTSATTSPTSSASTATAATRSTSWSPSRTPSRCPTAWTSRRRPCSRAPA